MIERAITDKESNNRFYQHNERMAKSWENLVEKYDGEITGIVNGFVICCEP